MNSFMIAFGLASVMLCIGVFLRAKIPFLRNMLVPSSVIAGILGFALINVAIGFEINLGTDTNMFTEIVNQLFTVSFISISLTSSPKGSGAKNMIKGAMGMGTVWSLLYALTPLVAVGIVWLVGRWFNMDAIYGMLIQFAFARAPDRQQRMELFLSSTVGKMPQWWPLLLLPSASWLHFWWVFPLPRSASSAALPEIAVN